MILTDDHLTLPFTGATLQTLTGCQNIYHLKGRDGRARMLFTPKTASLITIGRPLITSLLHAALYRIRKVALNGTRNSCFSVSGYETFACTFQMLESKQHFAPAGIATVSQPHAKPPQAFLQRLRYLGLTTFITCTQTITHHLH